MNTMQSARAVPEKICLCAAFSAQTSLEVSVMPWTTVMEPGNIIAEDIAIIC